MKIIGIGAWDRSGSTILAEILGSAPGVVSVGELNNLWDRGARQNRPCACGERFWDCPFWKPVMDRAFAGSEGRRLLEAVTEAADHMTNHGLIKQRLTGRIGATADVYMEGLSRLHEALAEATDGAAIVDSTKMPWHLDATERVSGVELWLIHLIRDPRGVVNSHRKSLRYDTDSSAPEMMTRQTWAFTTAGWVYRNLMLSAIWGRQDTYLRLVYEDFCTEPRRTVSDLMRAMGLTPPPFESANQIVLRKGHSVSGNPVRFSRGAVTIEADDAWRSELTPLIRGAVGLVTLPFRLLYRDSSLPALPRVSMESP